MVEKDKIIKYINEINDMLDIYKCKAGKIKKERGIRKSKRNRVDILDRLTRKDNWENSWEKMRRKWRRESWKHVRENILGRGKIKLKYEIHWKGIAFISLSKNVTSMQISCLNIHSFLTFINPGLMKPFHALLIMWNVTALI